MLCGRRGDAGSIRCRWFEQARRMGRKRIGQYSGRLLSMRIPWSLEGNVEATVVEVWSDRAERS